MGAVLNTLLEITVYAAVLYGAILLFKKVFHRQISAALNYAVWALFILRLMIPVTMDSGLHLFVVPQTPVQTAAANSINDADFLYGQAVYFPAVQQNAPNTANKTPADLGVPSPSGGAGPKKAATLAFDWPAGLVLLWAAGVCGSFVYMAVLRTGLHNKIRRNGAAAPEEVLRLAEACKKDMGIRKDIEISVQSWLGSPALSSSLWPKLLLPEKMLCGMDNQQLEFGIRHELTHYMRKDHLVCLLLMFLRCVYWFNPLVWLASRQIETDMETACDAQVTRPMEKPARLRYVQTMIDLNGGIPAHQVLGMGLCNERRSMEKRIKGLFMKKKTVLSVRLAAAALALVMLLVCFTTACQPTPEKPPVVNKADGALEKKITQAPSSGKNIREALSIPERWVDSFSYGDGKIKFSVDAAIEIPDAEKVPVAEVSPVAFTQERVDKMISVLIGDSPLYEPQGLSREDLQSQIIQMKSGMATIKNDKEGDAKLTSQVLENLQTELAALEKQYNDTPENLPKIPAGSKIGAVNDPGEGFTGVKAMAETLAGNMVFEVRTAKEGSRASMYPKANNGSWGTVYDELGIDLELKQPKGVKLSREEAIKIAADIAKKLDGGLEFAHCGVAATLQQYGEKYAWRITFNRSVNGFPTTYETHEHGMDLYADMYEPAVYYEKMAISISDKGVTGFEWNTPMQVDRLTNENVALMPFSDVEKAARNMLKKNPDQITRRYSGQPLPELEIPIGRITLGLMRIREKDRPGAYRLVPVWDFYHPDSTYCLLTLNAVDGSVIDRNLGY